MKVYKFKCKDCGAKKYEKLDKNTYRCMYCGCIEEVYNEEQEKEQKQEKKIIEVPKVEIVEGEKAYKVPKFHLIKLLLCIFVGYLGIHRFLEGKILSAFAFMFTYGFFGIGYFVDIIRCISEFAKEYKNLNNK